LRIDQSSCSVFSLSHPITLSLSLSFSAPVRLGAVQASISLLSFLVAQSAVTAREGERKGRLEGGMKSCRGGGSMCISPSFTFSPTERERGEGERQPISSDLSSLCLPHLLSSAAAGFLCWTAALYVLLHLCAKGCLLMQLCAEIFSLSGLIHEKPHRCTIEETAKCLGDFWCLGHV